MNSFHISDIKDEEPMVHYLDTNIQKRTHALHEIQLRPVFKSTWSSLIGVVGSCGFHFGQCVNVGQKSHFRIAILRRPKLSIRNWYFLLPLYLNLICILKLWPSASFEVKVIWNMASCCKNCTQLNLKTVALQRSVWLQVWCTLAFLVCSSHYPAKCSTRIQQSQQTINHSELRKNKT